MASKKPQTTIYAIYVGDEKTLHGIPTYIGKTSDVESQVRFHNVRRKYMESLYNLDLESIPVRFEILEIAPSSMIDQRKAYWIDHYNKLGSTLKNCRPVMGSDNRGAEHGVAKLKTSEVEAILERSETAREAARKYGVSKSCIDRIRRGGSWKGMTASGLTDEHRE